MDESLHPHNIVEFIFSSMSDFSNGVVKPPLAQEHGLVISCNRNAWDQFLIQIKSENLDCSDILVYI